MRWDHWARDFCRTASNSARSMIGGCSPGRISCLSLSGWRLFRERARRLPAVGELPRVDNAKLDRKGHKPRRPNRRALMPVNLPRHSEISSHGFSPQLQMRRGPRLEVRGSTFSGLRLMCRSPKWCGLSLRCGDRSPRPTRRLRADDTGLRPRWPRFRTAPAGELRACWSCIPVGHVVALPPRDDYKLPQ